MGRDVNAYFTGPYMWKEYVTVFFQSTTLTMAQNSQIIWKKVDQFNYAKRKKIKKTSRTTKTP